MKHNINFREGPR